MSTKKKSDSTVDAEAVRFIVRHLDGDLRLSTDPHSAGLQFFTRVVENVQQTIRDATMAEFITDARGHAPTYGTGSPLDLLRPVEMLHIAAAIDATEFDGIVDIFQDDKFPDVVRHVLMAVHDDVYSAVGAAIENDELGWDDDRLVVIEK